MEMDNVYIDYVEVIQGLDFYHSIYPAQKGQTDRHESDVETVDLCFILSGHILISASYLLHPGQCILFSCHREFTYQYPATERIHLLGFSTRRQLLKGMLNGLSDQVPPEMQNVINPGKSQETPKDRPKGHAGAQENLLGHEFYV